MKKIWKIALLATLALALTACGTETSNDEKAKNDTNNEQNEVVDSNHEQHTNSKKLVATKSEEDPTTGEKFEETTEITFDEAGHPVLVKSIQKYEKKETADQAYALLSLIAGMSAVEGEEPIVKVTQDGNSVTAEMPANLEGATFNTGDTEIPATESTYEDVRKSLELENYTIVE